MVNEGGPAGSRAEFLARLKRFTDMTLDRLGEASGGRDVDDKETRVLAGVALKVLSLWEKALRSDQPDAPVEILSQGRKKIPDSKKGDD